MLLNVAYTFVILVRGNPFISPSYSMEQVDLFSKEQRSKNTSYAFTFTLR